jgi:cyclase
VLKKRLIPKLLIATETIGGQKRPVLVTTRSFQHAAAVGDPVSQAKIFEAQLADELIVLNIGGEPLDRQGVTLQLVERLARETFMPLTIGGGVRTVEDCARLLEHGADKIAINSEAVRTPELITDSARQFGAQCIVVSIDFRTDTTGAAVVVIDRAATPTGLGVLEWARRAVALGAGELLLCDVDRDGSGAGLNCEIGRVVASSVPVPVVLSGGCGRAEHFVRGFLDAQVEGVAAGTFFSRRDQNPMQARAHVSNAGVSIRMET